MPFRLNPITGQLDLTGGQGAIGPTGPTGPTGAGGALGHWANLWDTTTQSITTINTPHIIQINSIDSSSFGVSLVGGSRITFANAGVYNISFSLQFTNADASIQFAQAWLRKNDSGSTGDIPDSNSGVSIDSKQGQIPGQYILTVPFLLNLAANDFIELVWSASSTNVKIHTVAAAHGPEIPGVIVTVQQVMYTQQGATGADGATGATGATGPMGPTGPSAGAGFDDSFLVGDWLGPTDDYYYLPVTHALDSSLIEVNIWDASNETVYADWSRTSNSIVTLKVPASPDLRFAGTIWVTNA